MLKETIETLLALQASKAARDITFESLALLSMLSFLSNDHKDIRGLWYHCLRELCAYPEFRTQLENSENSMLVIKRAIRTSEQTFLLQLIGVVRMIAESPKLLNKLIDPVTVPKLFDIYMGSLQWADASIEFYVVQTLKLIYGDENGKIHILKSEQILGYIVKCLTRDQDIQIANEAALLLIEILKEPGNSSFLFTLFRGQHQAP